MPRGVRKLALTAHVTVSVGWLGAVAGFLALAVTGVTSDDGQKVRSAYLLMELMGWFVLLPLALASFVTGLLQALGTEWGLFRHYWVLFKLLINVFATIVLLLYMQTLHHLADLAAGSGPEGDVDVLRSASPLVHALLALVLLLVATALAVYKPRGFTPYGLSKRGRRT